MINFFRKTRKKLADDNKFLKYSRYAIGEIALVVIGILIALQINNWNIERLERLEEIKILNQILEDINYELIYLETASTKMKNRINYLTTISDNKYSRDTLKIFGETMSFAFVMPKLNLTYNGLKTSNRLGLISDEKLSEMIVLHYEFILGRVLDHSDWHMQFTTNTVEDYLVKNVLFLKNGDVDPEQLESVLQTVGIASLINYQLSSLEFIVREINPCLKNAKELQESIKTYLNEP